MLSIHRATKNMRLILDIYFQIWIMLQSFLIGRLPVAMATILNSGFMVLCAMYSYIIYPSLVNMRHVVFWVTFVTVFSQWEALHCYHGNQIKITHIFLKRLDLSSMMKYNTMDKSSVTLIKFLSKIGSSHPIPPLMHPIGQEMHVLTLGDTYIKGA